MNPSFNQLATEILKVLPHATFAEDNEGQIIIYTDLCQTSVDNNDPLMDLSVE